MTVQPWRNAIASLADSTTGQILAYAPAPAGQLRTPVWLRDASGESAALGPVLFDLTRRTATAHGIVSFVYNTALVALMVNIAASAIAN